jgi:hypothetical protein
MNRTIAVILLSLATGVAIAQEPKQFTPDKCELIPLPLHQISFQIDGIERTRWHYGDQYPRPFFYPFLGPSGTSLTRMGHPGASDHDHHRSIWFAFHKVNDDLNFWADGTGTQIRQKQWLAYEDSNDEAIMACLLGYFDKEGIEVMEQETIAAILPMDDGEYALEFQITLRLPADREAAVLRQTNFGLLAVRVAKTVSHHFGGGQLSNSEGAVGEPEIFGKAARWMDYSGPVVVGKGENRKSVIEGITYIDHPTNPRHPAKWHVRSDGWMGASICMDEGMTLTKDKPLVLRYLLHSHRSAYDLKKTQAVADLFTKRPGFATGKRNTPHRQSEVWRKPQS